LSAHRPRHHPHPGDRAGQVPRLVAETAPRQAGASAMTLLDGRVALVTGAGAGIGRAVALALAREGAAVGINVMTNRAGGDATLEAVAAKGGRGMVLPGDISAPGV